MVPNTSELLPEPEMPVNTVSRRFGSSTLMSLRLFTRAPCTRIRSWLSAACSAGDRVSVFVALLIVAPLLVERSRAPPQRRPARAPVLRCDLLQQRVDACEAALCAFFDAVLHGGVALLGCLEAHRLCQPRLLAEVFELECLQVVLERLYEAFGWFDFAELALDDAVGGAEAVAPAGTDVHLLDDGAVAPPFGDQLWIGPDGVDVGAGCVED